MCIVTVMYVDLITFLGMTSDCTVPENIQIQPKEG